MTEAESPKKKMLIQRVNTIKQKQELPLGEFHQKIKKLKTLLAQSVSEGRKTEIFAQLDELTEIYVSQTKKTIQRKDTLAQSKQEAQTKQELVTPKVKKAENVVIFEVREGSKVIDPVKLQTPPRTPKPGDDKRLFVRFEPKKVTNLQNHKGIGQISPTK